MSEEPQYTMLSSDLEERIEFEKEAEQYIDTILEYCLMGEEVTKNLFGADSLEFLEPDRGFTICPEMSKEMDKFNALALIRGELPAHTECWTGAVAKLGRIIRVMGIILF